MAAALLSPVPAPNWTLNYNGVDITAEIAPMVRKLVYLDRLGSASGAIEIDFEDHGKLWQGPWYPSLGDSVSLAIGYQGADLQPCGEFQVDDLELDGPPDVLRLRALAAFITPAMRTANSIGYENQSLLGIAATIASKYGLRLVTAPNTPDLSFARITQSRETDLAFLRRLAEEHGYDFTVRGNLMVFYALAALEDAAPIVILTRADTLRFRFRNRTRRIYANGQVAYQNATAKELIQASAASNGAPTGDMLKLVARCENGQQAVVKANAALHLSDLRFLEAAIEGPGSAALAAGITMTLSGWGALDGDYLIETAVHRMERATGYTTAIAARRVS